VVLMLFAAALPYFFFKWTKLLYAERSPTTGDAR
jgi:hypothetical protein